MYLFKLLTMSAYNSRKGLGEVKKVMFTFSFVFLLKLYDLCFDVFIFLCLKYVIKYDCKNRLPCTWIVNKNFVCWERRHARYFISIKAKSKLFCLLNCFCVVQNVPINIGIEWRFQEMILDLLTLPWNLMFIGTSYMYIYLRV